MTARKYGPTCSYPGCGRRHNSHGLCSPHGAIARRGEPLRPIRDTTGPVVREPLERFAEKVALAESGCLEWLGAMYGSGYGAFFPGGERDGGNIPAHRFAHVALIGPIPDGYDIDHLCRNRRCVNPEHLEAATRGENIRRALAAREQRMRAAGVTPALRAIHARELEVARYPARNARRRELRRERGLIKPGPAPRDQCRRGHEMTAENSYYAPKSGVRSCRECRRLNALKTKEAA